jgi:hypothetical protein
MSIRWLMHSKKERSASQLWLGLVAPVLASSNQKSSLAML